MVTHQQLIKTDLLLFELAALRLSLVKMARQSGVDRPETEEKYKRAKANSLKHTSELLAQNVYFEKSKAWKHVHEKLNVPYQIRDALRTFAPQDDVARRRMVLAILDPAATVHRVPDTKAETLQRLAEKLKASKLPIEKPVMKYLRERELGHASVAAHPSVAARQVVRDPELLPKQQRNSMGPDWLNAITGLASVRHQSFNDMTALSEKIDAMRLTRPQLEQKIASYEEKVLRLPAVPALREIMRNIFEDHQHLAKPPRNSAPQEPPTKKRLLSDFRDPSTALNSQPSNLNSFSNAPIERLPQVRLAQAPVAVTAQQTSGLRRPRADALDIDQPAAQRSPLNSNALEERDRGASRG